MVGHNKLVDFTSDCAKFAYSGADGVLRVWDVASSSFHHEFRPAEHLTATTTCIKFAPQLRKKAKKRKNGDVTGSQQVNSLIALGTISGTIIVYDYGKQELLSNLTHSDTSSIVDLFWDGKSNLYSLAQNSTLIQWDVFSKKSIRTLVVNGNCSMCLLGGSKLVVGSYDINLSSIEGKGDSKPKKFTGHSTSITEIVPVPNADTTNPSYYFLSSAQDDLFTSLWCSDGNDSHPVASFMVKDLACSISASTPENGTVRIAVTTQKGAVRLFTHRINEPTSSAKPIKSKTIIRVHSGKNKTVDNIPILATYYKKDHNLVIVYSDSAVLKFEQLDTDLLKGDVYLSRTRPPPVINKESSLLKTVTPKTNKDTTHLRPGYMTTTTGKGAKRKNDDEDGTTSLPMEERLNALALDQPSLNLTAPPKADNLTQLLLQGLHSKDHTLLSSVLSQGDNDQLVNNTIRRLPMQAVVPLLKHLQTLTNGKGHRSFSSIVWLRALFYHHMSHLTTLQDRKSLMQPFYAEAASMMATQAKFTKLKARLDLILTQVTNRHKAEDKVVEPEALLVYKDESSDEEIGDLTVDYGGASESEDNWDDFSEINGQTDDESEMETEDARINAIKHRLENDGEDILISGDDDIEASSMDDDSDDEPKENGLVIASDESDDESV